LCCYIFAALAQSIPQAASELNPLFTYRAFEVEVLRQIEGLFRSLGFDWLD